jgi:hypothetical protein
MATTVARLVKDPGKWSLDLAPGPAGGDSP